MRFELTTPTLARLATTQKNAETRTIAHFLIRLISLNYALFLCFTPVYGDNLPITSR